MKAVAKIKREHGLDVIDAPEDPVADDQVLLRMRSASICGSDLGFYDFLPSYQKFAKIPVIMGHEFCGEIARTGKNVQGFAEGDRVSAESVIYCGACRYCRSGSTNICQNFTVFGMHRNGGFAEYVSLDPIFLHRIPDSLSFAEAGVVEPLSVVLNALEDAGFGGSSLGQFAAIIGPGPLGLFSAEVLRAKGAQDQFMIGVSIDAFRLEIARSKLGLRAVNSEESDAASEVRTATGGFGCDTVVVATAAPAALQLAFALVAKGGQIVLISIPHEDVAIPASELVRRQVSIRGSYGSSWKHYEQAIALLSSKRIRVKDIVTHSFALDEAKEAFETARSKSGCKVQFRT